MSAGDGWHLQLKQTPIGGGWVEVAPDEDEPAWSDFTIEAVDPEDICICGHLSEDHNDADMRAGPGYSACTFCPCDTFETRAMVEGV